MKSLFVYMRMRRDFDLLSGTGRQIVRQIPRVLYRREIDGALFLSEASK